ncbi:MAG: Hsp20/alpha crystallin family protein [Lentisphaerae bacterium]|nr:Hsp20/alpha crystallin family protein [Lentisphaerota bacterium]
MSDKKENQTIMSDDNKQHKCECITVRPAADVIDEYDGMEITFEVPGVEAGCVELEVKNRLLTLKAKSILHRRNLPIVYKRAFYLSDAVDADNITAKISDGVLTLFLPKSESAKVHKIPVE